MPPKRPPPTTKKPTVGPGRAGPTKPGPSRPGQARGAPVKKTSGTKTGSKGKAAAAKPAEKKGPTKEDLAAIVIQKYIRRFLAIAALKKLKLKKIEYEDLIEKLQHQAYIGKSTGTEYACNQSNDSGLI